MKKIVFSLFIGLNLAVWAAATAANPIIDFGIFNNPANSNKLEIRLKTTQTVVNGSYSAGVFTVRYPSSYNVNLAVNSSTYGYGLPVIGQQGGYNYFTVSFAQTFTVNWTAGQEYVVAVLQHSNNGVGNGVFELVTNNAYTIANNCDFYQELNGSSAERSFYQTTTSAPLPVNLLRFDARAQADQTVWLDWKSAAEINLQKYQVEHSGDGLQFKPVGQVAAKGGANTEHSYYFTHPFPVSGNNYYRLKMMDYDGTFTYSHIVIVTFQGSASPFSVWPNPTAGPTSLISRDLEKYDADLFYQVTDANGKLLLENKLVQERTDLNLGDYPPGNYFLNVRTSRVQIQQFKLVVTPQ
jgi:hypothetical protein